HSAFHAPDGTLRIKRVWNQTAKPKEGQSAPDKFAYGVELTDPDSIEAAGGDLDNDSHGSHVASIAAGSQNISDGAFRGMAPEADLVFVAVDLSNINRIPDAITYIFDYADEVGKPCVINMSLGTQVGPHDGTSSIDTYIDRLSGPGRIIVGSAGNDNPNKCHLFRVIGDQQVGKPLSTFIKYGYTLSTKYTGGTIDIWADKGMDLNVALVLYKLSTAEEVERASVVFDGEVGSLTLGRNIGGSIIYGTETNPLNGKTHVKMKSQVTSIRTDYAIAVEVTPLNAGELNLWAYNDIFFTANDLPAFMQPTAEESTVKEIGGTARRIITVGAYTTRDEFLVYGDTEPEHTVDATGELCYFSGNGPTADGRVKPNITAPGAAIEAA
ncbi:MAG: S8 family serine peptidase, partial [Bacteroidaceae bacterium]|nr:S8 family serine peptidase [Bacteroidaceae bacterium]